MLLTIGSTVLATKKLSIEEGGIELINDKNAHLIGKELTNNAEKTLLPRNLQRQYIILLKRAVL